MDTVSDTEVYIQQVIEDLEFLERYIDAPRGTIILKSMYDLLEKALASHIKQVKEGN